MSKKSRIMKRGFCDYDWRVSVVAVAVAVAVAVVEECLVGF